jgi:hypothetical protein
VADFNPITPQELANKTNTKKRYVREWLANQASGGYISYDAATGKYTLPPEQSLALANEDIPAFVIGGFQATTVFIKDEPKIAEAFRTDKGVDWGL